MGRMYPSEDDLYYSRMDDQEMVKARITVTFDIYVEIPDFDQEKIDPEEMLKQAVKDYEFKSEDISNWDFEEWV